MKLNCPKCRKETLWAEENPFRPFCSERCKLIDLGQWASGGYAIPVEEEHLKPEDQALLEKVQDKPTTH